MFVKKKMVGEFGYRIGNIFQIFHYKVVKLVYFVDKELLN